MGVTLGKEVVSELYEFFSETNCHPIAKKMNNSLSQLFWPRLNIVYDKIQLKLQVQALYL